MQDRIFGNKKTSMHADADRNGGVICASLCSPHQKLLPYPRIERERQGEVKGGGKNRNSRGESLALSSFRGSQSEYVVWCPRQSPRWGRGEEKGRRKKKAQHMQTHGRCVHMRRRREGTRCGHRMGQGRLREHDPGDVGYARTHRSMQVVV